MTTKSLTELIRDANREITPADRQDELVKRLRSEISVTRETLKTGVVTSSPLSLIGQAADMIEQQAAKIAAIESAAKATVLEGWKLVPVEPTEEMMLHESTCKHHAAFDMSCVARENRMRIYRAMLAAAPTAAIEKGDGRDAEDAARRALAATDSDRVALIRALQKALAFWMPKVFDDRSAHDAYLLVGYEGDDEQRCWGDEMVSAISRWMPLPAAPAALSQQKAGEQG
ncbi:MAG: Phage protein [uncultured Paraburkholderia sp.]|nr:MAG: Phage protein [uncultured Paraburkholderia sp.]